MPVSKGHLGPVATVFLGVDVQHCVSQGINELPQLHQHPLWERIIPFTSER